MPEAASGSGSIAPFSPIDSRPRFAASPIQLDTETWPSGHKKPRRSEATGSNPERSALGQADGHLAHDQSNRIQQGTPLPIDPDTASNYFKRYKTRGLDGLLRTSCTGIETLLDTIPPAELNRHRQGCLYLTVESASGSVERRRGVRYTGSAMTGPLHP